MKVATYKSNVWTLDTINVLKILEEKNKAHNFMISFGKSEEFDNTRRCVEIEGDTKKIWSFVVPLGFTPMERFPISSNIYWFFGPHQAMMDRLMAQGRGEVVWESFLTASRIEAGTWPKEDRLVERTIQVELHRLGYNPGPIDGVIGKETTRALAEAGCKDKLSLALQKLQMRKVATPKPAKVRFGEVQIPEGSQIQAYGDIRATRHENGAKLEIHGSGRVIIDIP